MRDSQDQEKRPPENDGTPKLGRLLIVLAFALLLIVAITVGSEAYFS